MATHQNNAEAPGHINNIWIHNLLNFGGLDLTDKGKSLGSSVALVGNSNVGKTVLLELLSAVGVFRARFVVNGQGTGLTRQAETNSNGEQPSVWDIVSGQGELCYSFDKTDTSKESLFVVEAVGKESDKPVFYGLYASKEDEEWSWHRQVRGGYRYSTAFILHADHLYVLDPTAVIHQKSSKLITKYELPIAESGDEMVTNLGLIIQRCLLHQRGNDVPQAEGDNLTGAIGDLDQLPTDIQYLLPSVVCTELLLQNNQPTIPNKLVDFITELLTSPSDINTGCLLLENPYSCVNMQTMQQSLEVLTNASLQVILTTYSEAALKEGCFTSVIRLFKTAGGVRRGIRVPGAFLGDCSKEKWDPLELLTSRQVLCVEGPSDVNVLGSFMVKATSKPENLQKTFNLDLDTMIIKEQLQGTFVFDVDGKGNFHKVTHLFLEQAHLCMFPFIVCDGDALYGGSAEAMRERPSNTHSRRTTPTEAQSHGSDMMEWQLSQEDSACSTSGSVTEPARSAEQRDRSNYKASSILGDGKKSVLHQCILCLKQPHPYVVSLYGDLCRAAFQQQTLGDVLGIQSANTPHRMDIKIPYLANEIVENNCRNDDEARKFAKRSLHTLAWHVSGKHDLESVIARTPGLKHIPSKHSLKTDKALSKSIANLMLMNGNTAIEELLHHLFTDYWPRVDSVTRTQT